MHKIKVAFYTIGCKLNFAESSSISRKFSNKIFEIISFKETSDIYVINTCSVTETANKEFKYIVRSFLRRNPKAFIIAVGCYAQLEPKKRSKNFENRGERNCLNWGKYRGLWKQKGKYSSSFAKTRENRKSE